MRRASLFAAAVLTFAALYQLAPARAPADTGAPAQAAGWAYYPNCDSARAAGVAPIHAGEPGYREPLDRDRDGIACEPYRGR